MEVRTDLLGAADEDNGRRSGHPGIEAARFFAKADRQAVGDVPSDGVEIPGAP